ncbi:hypothetical protein A5744_17145 [Mycobacterium sp. IS-1264]|nr:hypothetical protein A5744_17145 [Mycobacterium sp. IS-1264]
MAHAAGPGEEFVAPECVGGGAQDHHVSAQRLRVVPGQPTSVQAARPQHPHQPGVVRVARAAREHDPRMEDVRSGQLHARA